MRGAERNSSPRLNPQFSLILEHTLKYFSSLSYLEVCLGKPFKKGDLKLGGRRDLNLNSEDYLHAKSSRIIPRRKTVNAD